MSNGRNNFASAPSLGNWWNGHDYNGYYAPNYNNNNNNAPNRQHFLFPHNLFSRDIPITHRGVRDPWHSQEERVVTGFFSSIGFPAQQHPPLQNLASENGRTREVNQRPRQAIPISPPGFIAQQNVPISAQEEEDSRLTQEEQKKALTKLKKEIYNPPIPKNLSRRVRFYYKDHIKNNEKNDNIDDDDGKRCAICLEDFERNEPVMITPCNHMFHEECIVPWVKSNGQCPVCRFLICERTRETASAVNNGNINNGSMAVNDLFAGELISIIRVVEEAFMLRNVSR